MSSKSIIVLINEICILGVIGFVIFEIILKVMR